MKPKILLKLEQLKRKETSNSTDIFLPPDQVAEKLQVSQRTLRRWAAQGEIERDARSRYGLISAACYAIALYDKSGRNNKIQKQIEYNQKQIEKSRIEIEILEFKKQQAAESLIATSDANLTWEQYCEKLKNIIGKELPRKIASRIIDRIEIKGYQEPLKRQVKKETDRALEEGLSKQNGQI